MKIKDVLKLNDPFWLELPMYEDYPINIRSIINMTSSKKKQDKLLEYFKDNYIDKVENIMFKNHLIKDLPLVFIPVEKDGKIAMKISSIHFINKFLESINLERVPYNKNLTDDEVRQIARETLKNHIRKLEEIKIEKEKHPDYNTIYDRYKKYKGKINKFLQEELPKPKNSEEFIKYQEQLLNCGASSNCSFDKYLEIEIGQSRTLIYDMKSLFKEFSKPIDLNVIEENVNIDELYLYIASEFMNIEKIYEEDRGTLSNLFIYIEKYVFAAIEMKKTRKYNEKLEVTFKNKKNIYTTDSIISDYIDMRFRHPEFGSSDVTKALALTASWEFIRKGKKDNVIPETEPNNNIQRKTKKPEDMTKRKLNMIKRQKFFEETPYIYQVIGKNNFEGYIGYIYADGTVRFEKFYEDLERQIPADDNATYKMTIDNFEEMSRLTKPEIIRYILSGASDVRRFYHTKTWEERMKQDINASDYDQETVARIDDLLSIRKTLTDNKTYRK